MGRAIADRKHIGQRGAALRIDVHTIAARCTRHQQRTDGGDDADADDGHVRRQDRAIIQFDPANPAFPNQRDNSAAGAQIDPVGAVLGLEEIGELFPGHAVQDARQGFKQGHMLAQLGQNRSSFQPDIAAADHHNPVCGLEFFHDPVDIGPIAHRMDAVQIVSGTIHRPRIAAGGPDQLAIGDQRAICCRQSMGNWVDRLHLLSQHQFNILFGPERGRSNIDPLKRLFLGQVFLGERRPLIGRFGLIADHCDRTGKAPLPKRHSRLRAAMPGPDYHHIKAAFHAHDMPLASDVLTGRVSSVRRYPMHRNASSQEPSAKRGPARNHSWLHPEPAGNQAVEPGIRCSGPPPPCDRPQRHWRSARAAPIPGRRARLRLKQPC